MPVASFGEQVEVESGTIIMWAGLLSNVPSGWAVCDGNNGTPNMLGRFPHGIPDSATSPGTTGGTESETISNSQVPSHSHNTTVDNGGYHTHTVGLRKVYHQDTFDPATTSWGSLTSSAAGDHGHSATVDNTGSGATIDNNPAHYEIAYIQKL